MSMPRKRILTASGMLLGVVLVGCSTAHLEGSSTSGTGTALVKGNPGLGVLGNATVRLEAVDGHDLKATQSQARIPPGKHTLVLSCQVTHTGASNSAQIDFEARAGQEYNLKLRILKHYPGCSGVLVNAATGKVVAQPAGLGHAPNLSE